ncbi:hypothetical protein E2C01_015488 [Portunus trituberculatus]|uniref:Uncharacterized protein n=1 Tax=Portunus trituberculatus TaxID=210409 RepID=A0A5B7DN73_PORTR|nr:hypothetical protein [Portunus trituberculatus]
MKNPKSRVPPRVGGRALPCSRSGGPCVPRCASSWRWGKGLWVMQCLKRTSVQMVRFMLHMVSFGILRPTKMGVRVDCGRGYGCVWQVGAQPHRRDPAAHRLFAAVHRGQSGRKRPAVVAGWLDSGHLARRVASRPLPPAKTTSLTPLLCFHTSTSSQRQGTRLPAFARRTNKLRQGRQPALHLARRSPGPEDGNHDVLR